MKFSYSWLKELVDIKLAPDQLAEFLSLHAFETEILSSAKTFPNIIVAKVTNIEKHPNADRLRVITLTDGKQEIGPVVCGAWNFDVGAIVPLAKPGALIPHDQHNPEGESFTLAKATIRGIESQGMICSGKELGLSDDGKGILILDSSYKLGQTFGEKQSSEVMFDISLPANRPDLISYRGIAWEIAALTGGKYKPKNSKLKIINSKSPLLKVRISEPDLCKKYTATRLTNIKIGPSPKFIEERLKLVGLRPINNVVDITNYVMLETGQPLHAFDANLVLGAINVRLAYVNETITTLDKVNRKLSPDTLVIADSKKAIAVAGVMGGLDTAVTDNTTEIILEAANFNAISVRKTARGLGLRTDASIRFEKSLPAAFIDTGSALAIELLTKYAAAKPVETATAGIKPQKPLAIKFDPEQVNRLLGTKISVSEQMKILKRLGFSIHASRITTHALVPFWRPDVTRWQDLAEEIERFVGLDKIPSASFAIPFSAHMTDPIINQRDEAIDILVGLGYDEIYTYSFVSEQDLGKWQIDKKTAIEVANPLSSDQQYLRTDLGINVLKIAEYNAKEHENIETGKYFEIGNVFFKYNGKIQEETYLFMLSFPRTQKRIAELITDFKLLSVRFGVNIEIKQDEEQLAQIFADGNSIGRIGIFDGTSELKWAGVSLDFKEFITHSKLTQFKSINRFPSVTLDTSILVREDLPWVKIKETVLAANQKLVSEIILIEGSYRGKEISLNKKSVTFRIIYQAPNRTLTSEEVNKIHDQILRDLKAKFNAEVRD